MAFTACRVNMFKKHFFTTRCYASAVLAMALCLSVCPSICPSQVGVLLKRLNVGSHKQHHTIAQRLQFLKPKISAKFDWGHPSGAQNADGWVKIGDFRQITGYISKTVHVSVEHRLVADRRTDTGPWLVLHSIAR